MKPEIAEWLRGHAAGIRAGLDHLGQLCATHRVPNSREDIAAAEHAINRIEGNIAAALLADQGRRKL